MILLLDTDILIDIALDRDPHVEPAIRLLNALERGESRGFVAWHSISNFYYLVSGRRGRKTTREFIDELTLFVEVAPTSTADLRYANSLEMGDFEDAMQVAAATACGAEVIATRNVKDYRRSPIPAARPNGLF